MLECRLRCVKTEATYGNWTQLWEVDSPIATDGQRIRCRIVAIQLHVEGVARTHKIVGGHLNVLDRRERTRNTVEQVVTERLGGFVVERFKPQ